MVVYSIENSNPLSGFCNGFYVIHIGVLFGALCIGMAALASLMGALLQVRANPQRFKS